MIAKHDITIGVVRNKRLVHRKDAAVYRNTGPVFALVADPKTGREWKWKESDQPGLLDFLRQFVRTWHKPAVVGTQTTRGRSRGGAKTAEINRIKAKSENAKLLAAAGSIIRANPKIKKAELARMLEERGHGGRFAIEKKLPVRKNQRGT